MNFHYITPYKNKQKGSFVLILEVFEIIEKCSFAARRTGRSPAGEAPRRPACAGRSGKNVAATPQPFFGPTAVVACGKPHREFSERDFK